MKSFRARSVSLLFAILAFLSASPSATAGSYLYGISDDNKIHQVDLTSYIDTVVFDTGLAWLTNGVAWDSTDAKLYYRSPDNGSLYFWTQASNSQGNVIGAVGASGGPGDEDEMICMAGVQAAGLASG